MYIYQLIHTYQYKYIYILTNIYILPNTYTRKCVTPPGWQGLPERVAILLTVVRQVDWNDVQVCCPRGGSISA